MRQRFANSWELVKASFAVLRADKELILFPLVSGLATLGVMLAFSLPMLAAGIFDKIIDTGSPGVMGYIVAFLFYMTMYFVTIFANTALVGAALIRLNGGDPTFADGVRVALARVDKILGYAIIAATVGMILRYIRDKGGLLGQIVAWFGDMAWSIATYLVVPVLVVEDITPMDAVKRSSALLKKTWGEQIAGNFSITMIFVALGIGATLLIGAPMIILTAVAGSVLGVIFSIWLTVLMIAMIVLTGTTLNGIYTAALYRYATTGEIDARFFRPELIENAFYAK